jgi:hypothetical protein
MSISTITSLISDEEIERFYSEKFYFSYSGISKLLYSPRLFYSHYILRQREDSVDSHLVAGRATHCLLLEPERFNDEFIELPGKIPTDSNRIIIDHIFNNQYLPMQNTSLELVDFPQEILNQLLVNNLYQNLADDKKDTSKTGDSKRLDKMLTDNNKEYFEFLKKKDGKTVIDSNVKQQAESVVEMIKADTRVKALLQLGHDNTQGVTVYNELPLQIDLDKYDFGFKGIVDNIVVDENIKTIFINDLKLTSKQIQDFPDSVKYYRYDIQALMYLNLVFKKFIEDKEDGEQWNIIFTFIVVDKYNQVYPFQVSDKTLVEWGEEFAYVVETIEYHYKNKDFTLPYQLAIGNVKL